MYRLLKKLLKFEKAARKIWNGKRARLDFEFQMEDILKTIFQPLNILIEFTKRRKWNEIDNILPL